MNFATLLLLIMGALPAKTLRIDLATDARVVRYANAARPRDGEALVRGTDGYDAWMGPDGQYMIALEWDKPRDLSEVNIEFRHAIANRAELRVQYWQEDWPQAGVSGKAAAGDASRGHWSTAKADWWAGDRDVTFAFLPYNQEQPGNDAPDVRYRRTRRLLFLLGKGELPPVRYLHAYGPGKAHEGTFEILSDKGASFPTPIKVTIVNGDIIEDEDGKPTATRESELLIAAPSIVIRFAADQIDTLDRTLVTLQQDNKTKADFVPAQVAKSGQVELPGLHASVRYRSSDSAASSGSPVSTLPATK